MKTRRTILHYFNKKHRTGFSPEKMPVNMKLLQKQEEIQKFT